MLQEQVPGNDPTNYPALGQPVDELALAEIKGAILAKLRLAIGKDAGMMTCTAGAARNDVCLDRDEDA